MTHDEDLTPCNWSDVILDWLDTIGGIPLVHHVFHTFSKDLATETLYNIRKRITDNIKTLMMEAEDTSEARQMKVNNADITDPPAFSMPDSIDHVQTIRQRISKPPTNYPTPIFQILQLSRAILFSTQTKHLYA